MPITPISLSSLTPADGKLVPFVTTQAGSPIIESPTDIFASDDVGKRIKIASAGNASADLFATIAGYQSATRVTLNTNAATATSTRGALLGTDCGAALQSALDTAFATDGGTILIDALFYWETPVLRDFGTTDGKSLTIKGTGWGSGLLIAGDATKDMLTIQNCPKLVIRETNFAGCPMAANDCRSLLNLQSSEYILERNGFFGVSVAGPSLAGVVYARRCRSRHFDNEFGGCIASSGINTSVVDIDNFAFVDIARDRFIDYGWFQGALLSKTGLGFCLSWIRVQNPIAATVGVNQGSVVRITDCNFDEGHFLGVLVGPTLDRRIPQVHLSGNRANNTLLSGGCAFQFERIDNLVIEQVAIGWANTPHTGIGLYDCGVVLIDGAVVTTGAPGASTGSADGLIATGVRSLTLKNAQAFRRRQFTNVANVQEIINGVGGVAPFSKRGRVTDADFIRLTGSIPGANTLAYDEANRKLYIKDSTLGWVASQAMDISTDPTFFLNNGTPTTGTLTSPDTYAKTSGEAGWNTTAYLKDLFTGGFRMAVRVLAGSDMVLGAQSPTSPIPAGPTGYYACIGFGGGNILWGTGSDYWSNYPYAFGDLVELIYDPSAPAAAQMKLVIAGIQKATHAVPAGLSTSTQHRFSSAVYSVGSKFQLVDYTNI